MNILKVSNLTKTYKVAVRNSGLKNAFKSFIKKEYNEVKAVDDISFELKKGEIVGLIGPNGAGKSTTIKMLTGILKPDSGNIKVLGMNPSEDRVKYVKNIGVVFGQKSQLWWDIPAEDSFDLLKEIYDNQIEIEKKKDETTKNLNQIEMLRKKLETDYSEYEEKAILMVENAKKEARDILLDVQDEATQIIKEMNNLSKKNSKASVQEMYDLKSKVNDKIKDFSMNSKNQKGNLTPDEIKVGMQVYVIPLGKVGTVIKLPNASSEVEIQVGSLKTNISIDKLVRTKQETAKTVQPTKNKSIIKSKNISNEINVIGLTVDEAIPLVDKYLDDANIARLETVRIVHGKGTGKLKAGIHAFLKKHPHVKSYRMGTFGEGEMGVTVVTIK